MKRLVSIIGPTGIGKSQLALQLARNFAGEIVSTDSRQIYHYMDIGTAKSTSEELSLIPHHLINIINPDEDFNLSQYQELAYRAIGDIQKRNKLPFLVGGSGLYVWALVEGWKVPQVPPDRQLRYNLEKVAETIGADKLYQELVKTDPDAAQRIDPRNIRRVIRALEVQQKTKVPFPQLQRKKAPPFHTFIIGLTAERAELYRKIDQRVDEMIKKGWVAEVEKLAKMGYDFTLPAMSGIGYRQIGQVLRGELILEDAVQQIKSDTHRFVRHQYAWFQPKDKRIHWFDIQKQPQAEIAAALTEFLENN
ncbi:tRNA (adenosine(37)-N6)-dimethylallyltransferase MiaA [Chloroflexota bacterium]